MGISSVSTAHKDRGCGRAQASAVYNVVARQTEAGSESTKSDFATFCNIFNLWLACEIGRP